jgi:shikimate dehydrogenase
VISLSGKTRVFFIVGDPIAQVRAPAGVTAELARRGHDALVVPIHVAASEVDAFLRAAATLKNVDGVFATVPHKHAAFRHCSTTTSRAAFDSSANLLRRNPQGGWHGDMSDGAGFVAALRQAGLDLRGKRAVQAGVGGAGGAIAYSLLEAGVAVLAVHDTDGPRQQSVIAKLNQVFPGRATEGSTNPEGFDLVVNATPAGMRPHDPLPFRTDTLDRRAFVGDVITWPEVTPLLAAARQAGCATTTGVDMFNASLAVMVDFMTGQGPGG